MMGVIFAITCLCFIQSIHTNAQSSQQNVRYVKYSNTRAVADVLKTPSARSTLECTRICTELDNCTAYSVRADLVDNKRQCELLNMTAGCGAMQNNESYTLYGKFCIITSMHLNYISLDINENIAFVLHNEPWHCYNLYYVYYIQGVLKKGVRKYYMT